MDGVPAPLEILDTAGQEEFLPMQDEWIRESRGFVLVYSVTDKSSLEHVRASRQKIIRIKEGEVCTFVPFHPMYCVLFIVAARSARTHTSDVIELTIAFIFSILPTFPVHCGIGYARCLPNFAMVSVEHPHSYRRQ